MSNNLTPIRRLDTHQSASYTGTAGTITNPVGSQTRKVRVIVTTAAYVKIGNSPTATTGDVYMAANVPEYFIIAPSQSVSGRGQRNSVSGSAVTGDGMARRLAD